MVDDSGADGITMLEANDEEESALEFNSSRKGHKKQIGMSIRHRRLRIKLYWAKWTVEWGRRWSCDA